MQSSHGLIERSAYASRILELVDNQEAGKRLVYGNDDLRIFLQPNCWGIVIYVLDAGSRIARYWAQIIEKTDQRERQNFPFWVSIPEEGPGYVGRRPMTLYLDDSGDFTQGETGDVIGVYQRFD